MFLIKLGGSIITDKGKQYAFKETIMDRLSGEIKKSDQEVLLVHGAGSFGHILAKQHALHQGYTTDTQLQGFSDTHAMVQHLNSLVLTSLHKQNIPAVSLPPHAILHLDNHQPLTMDYTIFNEYLHQGFTPVTFGDVVLDKTLGFSICSGDLLMLLLADYFKPEKVLFVLDEDGIFTSNPKTNKNAELVEKATISDLETLTTSADDHADVTKGMQGKIETIKNISRLGIDTILLNGNVDNRLYDTLVGKQTIHTLVYGEKR